jgi:hypothetical protein
VFIFVIVMADYKAMMERPLVVKLSDEYRNISLSRASMAQIIETIRAFNKQHHNIYEETLYSELMELRTNLVSSFDKLLVYNNEVMKETVEKTLLADLPQDMHIFQNVHGKIRLSNASFGTLLYALKQRVKFILERKPPVPCLKDNSKLNAFNQVKNNLTGFNKAIADFESGFVRAVDNAHKAQQKFYASKKVNQKISHLNV